MSVFVCVNVCVCLVCVYMVMDRARETYTVSKSERGSERAREGGREEEKQKKTGEEGLDTEGKKENASCSSRVSHLSAPNVLFINMTLLYSHRSQDSKETWRKHTSAL